VTAAALVAAGLLSVVVFPPIATALMRPARATAAATNAPGLPSAPTALPLAHRPMGTQH
jgi:hypothetical protein